MKKLLLNLVLFIAVFSSVKAQTDYCKDIAKVANAEAVRYSAPTPGPEWATKDNYAFSIRKSVFSDHSLTYLVLSCTSTDGSLTKTDVIIKFEDSDQTITQSQKNLILEKKLDTKYFYTVIVGLEDADIKLLKTNKVKSFSLAGETVKPFLGDFKKKTMAYANCIDASNETPPPVVQTPDKKSIDGFWGIKFGSSAETVKATMASKGSRFDKENSKADQLYFFDAIFTGRKTGAISASMIDNKFYEAGVSFPELEEIHIISTFDAMVSELSDVYGTPKIVKNFQEPYKEGDGYEVQAIKLGKASYYAKWTTNNGNTIFLQISSKGRISIFYTDTTLEKTKNAKKTSDY